ncbi:hypothetical protein NJBCHELONAE_49000 [Mycobacteroides chelonae]|uniref:type II toxin-antitoxin system Phd/YefM family antitoxin n=1 Tax=Mycobacteroides chelonae TaxID=1774 RepID=UPI0021DE8DB4|nr:type II toxin-antitoxin system Phd/YefM family antitoxin [Mycobacteroides chelonae]GLE59587.1 hypothetical protein NJBCHELONAE_49000 [Mycobacteroides chelonae]
MMIDERHMVSATDAARDASRLFRDASKGERSVVMTNNKPTAAIVSMDDYRTLSNLESVEEDMRLLSVALVRTVTDNGRRYSREESMADLGVTQADLDAVSDEDLDLR